MFVRLFKGVACRFADPFGLGRPPVDHVGIEQDGSHAYDAFQASPVENN